MTAPELADTSADNTTCPVCRTVKPASEFCPNECHTLIKSGWQDGVTEADVVASLLGSLVAGRYMPTIVRQIDFVYRQRVVR